MLVGIQICMDCAYHFTAFYVCAALTAHIKNGLFSAQLIIDMMNETIATFCSGLSHQDESALLTTFFPPVQYLYHTQLTLCLPSSLLTTLYINLEDCICCSRRISPPSSRRSQCPALRTRWIQQLAGGCGTLYTVVRRTQLRTKPHEYV